MERNYGGNYANSIRFIRELRRMMPPERHAHRRKPRSPDPVPSPSLADLRRAIESATHLPSQRRPVSRLRAVEADARGENFAPAVIAHNVVPSTKHHYVDWYKMSVYGGRFVGSDGARFVTSCQDKLVCVYETGMSECQDAWRRTHAIAPNGVRWTVTDFDVSPDGRWLAYASMNRYVHLVDLSDQMKPHVALDFASSMDGQLDVWSLKWTHDGREIIVGTSEGRIKCYGRVVVYDVEVRRIVEVIEAHDEDVNSVCFMQTGERNLILSASDDALVKMWDRRDSSARRRRETHRPCGLFVGHQFGLTHVSTKDDGRFFLSNGKDQYIKLWDARKCTSQTDMSTVRRPPRDPTFDYRTQAYPRLASTSRDYRDDSVMTYAGEHETLQTLIRAHFSPAHTTGQKYIYCGSSDGRCVIYDVLTGKVVRSLAGHDAPVRDVSWHPFGCFLTTSSWDGQVVLWSTDSELGSS